MAPASNINIRRDVEDTFYRYKMPRLQSKIEGKGNGIKTVVPNLEDIGRSLSRDPIWVMKFFGFELGAQTKFDSTTDRYIVNGAHDADKLQDLLDIFIKKYVLCKSCKNPETILGVSKEGKVVADCKACGVHFEGDQRHKLSSYILKNQPKRLKKKSKKKGEEVNSDETKSGENSDDELTRRIQSEAAELLVQTNGNDKTTNEWTLDTSESAAKARLAEFDHSIIEKLALENCVSDEEEEEVATDNLYKQFEDWVYVNKSSVSDVEIYKKAQELKIESKSKTLLALTCALFDEDIIKQIPKYAALFVKIHSGDKYAKAILGGIEKLVGNSFPNLLGSIPRILMEFYQFDLLSEDVLQKWGTTKSKKYVDKETSKRIRKAATPFLKWLDEAEDDDDE